MLYGTANILSATVRPNRLEKNKDRDYHLNYGRYCAYSGTSHPLHRDFMINAFVYWNFYKGNQWILNDDLEGFLTDESGTARNRTKFVENLIEPMIRQYIGNAIRMSFNARAENISPMAKNRRETQLENMKLMTRMAKDMPAFREDIKKRFGVGDTMEETENVFNLSYTDKYTEEINNLIRYVTNENDFDLLKIMLAEHLAVTGLGLLKGYEQNGEQLWSHVDPIFYFFDRGAQRPDLRDASFMGEILFPPPTELFERFQNLSSEERKNLEKFAAENTDTTRTHYGIYGTIKDRIPVYETYWKDTEIQEYGYVRDNYGYEMLTRINDEEGTYKDKDLITPKEENHVKFLGEKKKKRNMVVDVLRYCIFTPGEFVSTGKGQDIVYEFGILPYQETMLLSPSNVEFPYKVHAWEYNNGDIQSPIRDVIDPQRRLNRTNSIAESHANNARGTGTVIDKSALDPQGGEEEVLRNMNLSKPVIIDTQRNGVPNAIGVYGTNLTQQMTPFFEIATQMRMVMQNVTGINEAMTGTGSKKYSLVGVERLQVERGTLLQEPFYNAIQRILLQAYQAMASQGKRIYAESKRRLSIMVGDEGADEIIITKEMLGEDFRVFVKRVERDEEQKAEVNQMLMSLLQLGTIGQKQFAELFGRGLVSDISKALREYQGEKNEIARRQTEQQATIKDIMQTETEKRELEAKGNAERALSEQLSEAERERQHDIEKQALKDAGKWNQLREKLGKPAQTEERLF